MLSLEWAVTTLEKALGVIAESFLKSSVQGAMAAKKTQYNAMHDQEGHREHDKACFCHCLESWCTHVLSSE